MNPYTEIPLTYIRDQVKDFYIVAGMAKGITGTKPFRFKDEAVLFYKNISKTIPNCWIEVIFGFPSAKILPSDLF